MTVFPAVAMIFQLLYIYKRNGIIKLSTLFSLKKMRLEKTDKVSHVMGKNVTFIKRETHGCHAKLLLSCVISEFT